MQTVTPLYKRKTSTMKNLKRVFDRGYLFLAFPLLLCSLTFAERQPETSVFDHLGFDEVIRVEIETDLDSLVNTKLTEEEMPGIFSYKDKNGKKWQWNIELQVRGKFRRRICPFPPLFVNFSKKELEAAGLNDHNDFKLVTHCVDNEQGDENILREYLTYKLYQIVAKESYRVQLLKIRYRDSESGSGFTRYGILLEDEDEMRTRFNSRVCEDCYSLPVDSFQIDKLYIHDLFQYMVGNTDWSLKMLRNMKLLRPKDGSGFLVVPYDFDFSGLVSAPYAIPDPTIGIRTVRERRFLGSAQKVEELSPTIEHFKSKKQALMDCIRRFKPLNQEARQEMIEYMESFYRCLDVGLDLQTPGKC